VEDVAKLGEYSVDAGEAEYLFAQSDCLYDLLTVVI